MSSSAAIPPPEASAAMQPSEGEFARRLTLREQETLETQVSFPQRPGGGSLGRPIRLLTNFFPMETFGTSEIIHYDVEIKPEVPSSRARRNIFRDAMGQYKSEFGGPDALVYDGFNNAYAAAPLSKDTYSLDILPKGASAEEQPQPEPEAEAASSSEQPARPPRVRKTFQLNLKRVEVINLQNLTQFLQGKINWTPYEAIHALEIILRHVPSSLFTSVARSFYMDTRTHPISGGAEVWEGYFQSLRPSFGRMLLNVDTAATAFHQPINVATFAFEFTRNKGASTLSPREAEGIERQLRNVAVKITHRGAAQKRKYKVICLTRDGADRIFFESPNGKISVAQYFEERYKMRLKYPRLPCVQVAPAEKKIFLPMEVCEIFPGQRVMSRLSEDQTADMIKITCIKPQERVARIKEAYSALKFASGSNPVLDAFKIKVGGEVLGVDGRILEAPTLYYGDRSREPTLSPKFGAWNLMDKTFDVPATISSWAIVNFSQRCHPGDVDKFVRELCSSARSLGMTFKSDRPPVVQDSGSSPLDALKRAGNMANQQFATPPQLFIIILPSTASDFYGQVKMICDTVLGVPSQCMLGKNVPRANKMFCANLLMKINMKLGGVNVHLGKQLSFFVDKPTIVFGADVTHPGIGESGKPSIAALVATIDAKISKYSSIISLQDSRMELIADLKNMVKAQLRAFYGATQKKPERVLFYRDGVSEGQFAQLMKTEVAAIKAACDEIEKGYSPTITFVVIQKRHHVRFFPTDARNADRSGNVPAGTVVDSGVCHPTQFDFFLCSHAGIQGTSRPTHYHVLFDENRFTADSLQDLSYKMCYTFARCTRSVSFVPPAYYAHLAAFRARFHFDDSHEMNVKYFQPMKPQIQKSMYFV